MRSRLVIALLAGSLIAAVSPAPAARAADPVVAHDTKISRIFPLDSDLVYFRDVRPTPKRSWMARFHGRLRPARGIPSRVFSGDIGLDARGRKVFTFGTWRQKNGRVLSTKWFVYDLAKNRTSPLRGLPTNSCVIGWAAVWRDSIAYDACGLFVRQGKRTRLVSEEAGGSPLVFRGGTLAVVFDTGLDDLFIEQWMANGKRCAKRIDTSYGDATAQTGWYPSGLWTTGGAIIWTMGNPRFRSDFAILTAKIPAGCETPAPVGRLPFTPETATVRALAVDGRTVFYAGGATLRRHTLPSKPSFDPPPNDDFENAQQLPPQPPFTVTGRAAYTTVQPGEPLADTKHTIWYAYRPATSGTVYVTAGGGAIWDFNAQNYVGTTTYGVYTGTSRESLTRIPSSGYVTRVDAVAGETYWIAIGSPVPEPNYEPIGVHVDFSPPSG